MVLMAAMTVPGHGPEQASGEVKQERLDLSGKWEGRLHYRGNDYRGELCIVDNRGRGR